MVWGSLWSGDARRGRTCSTLLQPAASQAGRDGREAARALPRPLKKGFLRPFSPEHSSTTSTSPTPTRRDSIEALSAPRTASRVSRLQDAGRRLKRSDALCACPVKLNRDLLNTEKGSEKGRPVDQRRDPAAVPEGRHGAPKRAEAQHAGLLQQDNGRDSGRVPPHGIQDARVRAHHGPQLYKESSYTWKVGRPKTASRLSRLQGAGPPLKRSDVRCACPVKPSTGTSSQHGPQLFKESSYTWKVGRRPSTVARATGTATATATGTAGGPGGGRRGGGERPGERRPEARSPRPPGSSPAAVEPWPGVVDLGCEQGAGAAGSARGEEPGPGPPDVAHAATQ